MKIQIIQKLWVGAMTLLAFASPLQAGTPGTKGDTTADRVLGQTAFDSATTNIFTLPSGIAVDTKSGRLYVADAFKSRILVWPSSTNFTNGDSAEFVIGQTSMLDSSPNGGGLVSENGLNAPQGLALDAQGNLYVADTGNHRVLVYETSAGVQNGMAASKVLGQTGMDKSDKNQTGTVIPTASSLNTPADVALDSNGNLYVADSQNNRGLVYPAPLSSGMPATVVFGQADFAGKFAGAGSGGLKNPKGLTVDGNGNLYVSDYDNHRVVEYDNAFANPGNAVRVFGQPDFSASSIQANNGGVSSASLNNPWRVVTDKNGNLYITDSGNHRILKYNSPLASELQGGIPAAQVFGQADMSQNTANLGGSPSADSLFGPAGLAIDPSGNLFVTDTGNRRMLSYDGVVPYCGDGAVDTGEACDDGDRDAADGCDASCVVESGWTCTGSPKSACTVNPAPPAAASSGGCSLSSLTGSASSGSFLISLFLAGMISVVMLRFKRSES